MPSVQASYFLGQRLVAQTTFPAKIAQRSLAYLCLTCGEVWGRVLCVSDGKPGLWDPVICPCEKHRSIGVQDWGKIPGTFLLSLSPLNGSAGRDAALFQNFPTSLLQRELTLHLDHYERITREQP